MTDSKPRKPVTAEQQIEQLKATLAEREAFLVEYAKKNSELETRLAEETDFQLLIAKHDIRDEELVGVLQSMSPEARAKHAARIAGLQEPPAPISRKSGLPGPGVGSNSLQRGVDLHNETHRDE